MNSASKGRRLEHKSKRMMEDEGYAVIRAAASKGFADLVALDSTDIRLVEVKSFKAFKGLGKTKCFEKLRELEVPVNAWREVHVWPDCERTPHIYRMGTDGTTRRIQ